MEKIKELEGKEVLSSCVTEQLTVVQHSITLVVFADYQMTKPIPNWGNSPQPGSTYYFQKLSCNIFGVVDHREETSAIYLTPETYGPKNTDHTVSYLFHYFRTSGLVSEWIKCIHLYMHNAGSTNKNFYTMAWAQELVQQNSLQYI